MYSIDLGEPIFDLKNIKIIPRWQWWLLKLVPTHHKTDGNSTISFKRWRGVVYIVEIEDQCSS
ncbi:hypothetical protein LCGC14_1723680 [marine sediment metagenome]|uniref:Uncharacterized protein n=1 Tax=marine sediment metagenome TaxID=412755 RepID=A0A0F9HZD9_9ZZZZ